MSGGELSDAQLLAAVRTDLVRSPFQGEGHRKVQARRVRILDRIRVSRTRVLRVMRTRGLLSPTADYGWAWTFAAVDHENAECVGWHVCKVGSRFAALEPLAQGLGRLYGSVEADVACGLALRMDHGSQYLSDHLLNQLRYWGIHPSFALLEEPETNGVVERWNRTLKEQAVYGRVFETSPRCARPSLRSSNTTTSAGASKSWRIARHSKRVSNTSNAMPRSVNVCPRNRVRYIVRYRVCADSMRADLPVLVWRPSCTL